MSISKFYSESSAANLEAKKVKLNGIKSKEAEMYAENIRDFLAKSMKETQR